jgi:MFS family permease
VSSRRDRSARGRSREALVRRNTSLLMGAQAAVLASAAIFVSLGVVTVVDLMGAERWGGVFLAASNLCGAGSALAVGRLMDRLGRRPGLALGHALLGLSGAAGALAVWQRSTVLIFACGLLFGAGLGAAMLNRVAVADMYPAERRGRVVGAVLAAGTAGAVGGAPLVAALERLTGSDVLPWLVVPVFEVAGLAAVLALRPDPRELAVHDPASVPEPGPARPLGELLRIAPIRASVAAIAVAQTGMVAIMGVTPIAIHDHGGGALAIAVVISLHIAGMFALGPAIGTLLDRYGRRPGLLAGCGLAASGAVLGSFAHEVLLVAIGLTLVGLGWAACYLGATAVISDLTTAEERAGTLGMADLSTSVCAAAGVLASGFVLESAGLAVVGVVVAGLMVPVCMLVLPLREPQPGTWAGPTAMARRAA